MNAKECLNKILNSSLAKDKELKFCLVDENKIPYKINGTKASSNDINSFFDLKEFEKYNIDKFKGMGVSIQFSNLCGIDIDHCFSIKNDFSSADERAKDIFNLFKDFSYIEFSFSGTGMRILFRANSIENYKNIYYIKNSNKQVEYYQPSYGKNSTSYRYLTVTGNTIVDNPIIKLTKPHQIQALNDFLDKYMKKNKSLEIKEFLKDNSNINNDKKLKYYLLKDYDFQNNWFANAPGSNSNESERDYWLIQCIYKYVTRDYNEIIKIFEKSPFYLSKDYHHKIKWNRNNKNYSKIIYEKIKEMYK